MRVLPNIVGAALGLILLAGGMGAAQAAPNCMTPTLGDAEEGRRAFLRLNCYSCHGMSAHGASMGPSLVGEASETADAVLNGEGGGMPSFQGYLCDNDVAYLTAYIQSLGTSAEPKFVRWWEPVPSR